MPPPVLAQVARAFDVSPARVFDAWLNPDLISRWMFGPALRDETVLRIAVEPREGGRFSFLVLRDGQEIDHAGEYLALARPHRLTFTWGVAADPRAWVAEALSICPQGRQAKVTRGQMETPRTGPATEAPTTSSQFLTA